MGRAATNDATVRVVEESYAFSADDGTELWFGGYAPIDEDGDQLSVDEHRTSDPRCFFCRVAGTSYRREALQGSNLSVGAQVILLPEPANEHDTHAIAVWDGSKEVQLGYVPKTLNRELAKAVPRGKQLTEFLGGVVISEFRAGSQAGPRVGLRILVGPVGAVRLSVATDDEEDEDAEAAPHVSTLHDPSASETVVISCPSCGSPEQLAPDAAGFRCKVCQQDVWIIRCRRCEKHQPIFGSAAGAGSIEIRCQFCRTRNVVAKQELRNITAEVRRSERAETAARREAIADQKAQRESHIAVRGDEAAREDATLQARLRALEDVLKVAVTGTSAFAFEALKQTPVPPSFSAGELSQAEDAPELATFMPPRLTGLGSMLPGAKRKHEERVQKAESAFVDALEEHERREADRTAALAAAKADFEKELQVIKDAASAHNAKIDDLERRLQTGEPEAVSEYYAAALAAMPLPYDPVTAPRVAYSPQSRQLVIQLALPTFDVIPEDRQYRYVKTRDEITSAAMPTTERRRRYTDLIAQVTLCTLHYAFQADSHKVIDSTVVNGHVESIDKKTGRPANPCLVTVRATPDRFGELDLTRVDPAECLKGLSASLSRSPAELVPVRPVIDFDMADPRFVTEQQVLATLDTRPNLMELTPSEFESLITNLFEQMGLDTKLTQASRDGGVDCVAYDARPILGGKVVIQAKRYKNTVGVSAVRDLFGTMQNEGATKGILVTTSGYGQASHEFSNGKPLELIDGGNLLYLLQEHAGIEAKIEVPDDWVDPEPEM